MNADPPSSAPMIVAYDGSAEARDAIELAKVLARALRAPVVACSVVTAAPFEVDLKTYMTELEELGDRLRAEASKQLSGVDQVESVAIPAPSPPRELDRIATQRGARMIVLGSTHRGPARRVVPGTVADRLLAAGGCDIAVAPRGYSHSATGLSRIGVAFDGSPEAHAALDASADLAAAANASLDLLAVINPVMPAEVPMAAMGYGGLVASPQVTREQVDQMWATARAAVQELDVDVRATIHVVEGRPADVLIERSSELDLLYLGSRGYGPLGRVLMGSVSTEVIRGAVCPVIVAPRPLQQQSPPAPVSVAEATAT